MARRKLSDPKPQATSSRLSSASKKAAQKVAEKLASGSKETVSTVAAAVNSFPAVVGKATTGKPSTAETVSGTVPGLPALTPDQVSGMLPKFDLGAYQISDPLNPPESLPQATEAQRDKGKVIYEGTQRALELTGYAFDTSRVAFTALGKQAKAYGAGIQAATELEKVKGNYLDYLTQTQTTEQKKIALDLSQTQTLTDSGKADHKKTELSEKLKQAEIGADKAREETQQKQTQLAEFRKQLGEYLPTK
jgi:hypothetical protein